MSNSNPNFPGQNLGSGDDRALFEEQFAGEILTAFETRVVLKPLINHRSVSGAKSISLPATWRAGSKTHTKGAEVLGDSILHTEIFINIDDTTFTDVFIADIDEAMIHYDVRRPYTKEMGEALARTDDLKIASMLIQAARGSALFTGDTGGSTVISANARTDAVALGDAIAAARETLELKDVMVSNFEATAALATPQWYLLLQDEDRVLNRDVDGGGSFKDGTFSTIYGVRNVKSNNLPWGSNVNSTLDSTISSKYEVDCTNTVCSVFTEDAVANVDLMGLRVESHYDPRRFGDLMTARFVNGKGPYRTKCAVEIAVT